MTRSTWLLIGAAALALGACGKVGALDRPAPLYGEKAKAQYQAEQAERIAKARADRRDGEPEALPPAQAGDPYANPAPPRSLPIPGSNPTPNSSALPGVLPDPYANPQ
ncbi:MAG TPA: hypothetical protein VII73_12970 [Caulobacteraceae bacterium]